ncbi:MAG TPA: hypothetical protein VMG58_02510, partial [Candidatus Sulfotelmatobacter sp.]|nr:hypothetical protein [Candidatus Sulfotelmatobacter sp.]
MGAQSLVVLIELGAEAAGFGADDGLGPRVVTGIAAVDLDADDALLEAVGMVVQTGVHHEAEEVAEALGLRKRRT